MFAVIDAAAAFAGIVGEAALLGADIERADGVRAERAEAHRRNVEDRRRIGLRAIGPADDDAKRLFDRMLRRNRMVQPFEAGGVDVVLRTERPFVQGALGALIDDGALVAGERRAVLFAFQKILADLRTDFLQDEANVRGQRIVAQHGVPLLDQIVGAEHRQCAKRDKWNRQEDRGGPEYQRREQDRRDQHDRCVDNQARAQRQQQYTHGIPPRLSGRDRRPRVFRFTRIAIVVSRPNCKQPDRAVRLPRPSTIQQQSDEGYVTSPRRERARNRAGQIDRQMSLFRSSGARTDWKS